VSDVLPRNATTVLLGVALTGVVSFIGATLVARAGKAPKRWVSHAEEQALEMPFAAAFKLERRGRPLIRGLFFLLVAVILAYQARPSAVLNDISLAILVAFLGCVFAVLIIDGVVRCKSCGRRMLIRSVESPPWYDVDQHRRAILGGSFRCMYCGQLYLVSEA
jgi:hypothetical protein